MKKEDKNKNLIKPKRRYDVTDDLSENVSRFSKKVISETKKEREQNKNISKSKRRDTESERSEGLSNISTKVIIETKQGKSNKENVYKKISPIKTKGKDEESVFSIISRISKKLSDKNKKTYTVKSKRVTERSDYFSENVNPFSNEISVQTKKGKEEKRIFTKPKSKRDNESELSSAFTNITTKILFETKKGKEKAGKGSRSHTDIYEIESTRQIKGKYSKPGKEEKGQNYFSKSIIITPGSKEYEKSEKYFSKNIVMLPKIKGYEQSKYLIKSKTSYGSKNLNIETKKGKDYNKNYDERKSFRNVSHDDKKICKCFDILKGVQYYTKSTAESTKNENKKTPKSNYSFENQSLKRSGNEKEWKELSCICGSSVRFSSGRLSKMSFQNKREKRPWDIDVDRISGRASSEQEVLNDSLFKSIKSMDDLEGNSRFYHKEITIKPVFIPPVSNTQQ